MGFDSCPLRPTKMVVTQNIHVFTTVGMKRLSSLVAVAFVFRGRGLPTITSCRALSSASEGCSSY